MPKRRSADRLLIKLFEGNSCASPVVCGRPGRASGKFWWFATRALRSFDHAAVHGDFAVTRMHEVRPRFGFHERRVLQKFAVQANPGIRPSTRSRAMQNVQLIGAIDLRLRLLESDGAA